MPSSDIRLTNIKAALAFLRLGVNPGTAFIVSGDLRAGNVFHPPVRILVDEIIPQVSEPPGNSSEFQAYEDFLLRVEKPSWFFNALGKAAIAFLLLMAWVFLPPSGCMAENEGPLNQSQVVRLSLQSAETGIRMPFLIYLPKGYGGGDAYPVLYALHSYTTSETMWLDAGVGEAADDMAGRGELRPMIMVFPLTRYDSAKAIQEDMLDGVRGESGMGRFLTKELIPTIDAHYDTVDSPEGRTIGGYSMGGYFALEIAFTHPDLFSKAGAFNPALTSSDFSGGQFEKWLYPDAGPELTSDAAAFAKAKGLDKIQVSLDCGRVNDPFSEGAQSLNLALQARKIPVTFSVHEGGHSLQTGKIREYLLFFGGGETTPGQ